MDYPDLSQQSWPSDASTYSGIVLAVQANYYWVQLHPIIAANGNGQGTVTPVHLLCTRRARLKKIGQQVMVGDQVEVENPDFTGGRGAIAQVLPRRSVMDRPPIANVDQVLLLFALAEPDLDPYQISRFLIKAELSGLHICLCLNKQDLVRETIWQDWRQRLYSWGYVPLLISVDADWGMSTLEHQLSCHTTVVSGPSGVGKSSLINRFIPAAELRTNAVSGKLGRGRHTTRHVELFKLPGGGFLADTPGFNQPDLALSPELLGDCFPEIRQRLQTEHCQFSDCLHQDEPGCMVGQDWERYPIYLTLLDEVLAYQKAQSQRRDQETAVKVKVGQAGQIQHEPKLQAKKYRRVSRRSRNQALQDFCDGLPESVEQLEGLGDSDFDGTDYPDSL